MTRITLYFVKTIIAALIALFVSSCTIKIDGFDPVEPMGQVITKKVSINETFENITTSNGLNVILTQSNTNEIQVEAQENLHEYIKVYVKNNTLYVEKEEIFANNATKNIYVSTPKIQTIKASSGSSVTGKNSIKSKKLNLDTSSAATITIETVAEYLTCEASSGSEINIRGKVINFNADSSSGATIYATELTCKDVVAAASSGSVIKTNAINKLDASASSGANIYYTSTPNIINKNNSSGGSITTY
nr:head GIN domain-containing protein [uncultured Flavobacterium sp.]